jgi:hypothetical protein
MTVSCTMPQCLGKVRAQIGDPNIPTPGTAHSSGHPPFARPVHPLGTPQWLAPSGGRLQEQTRTAADDHHQQLSQMMLQPPAARDGDGQGVRVKAAPSTRTVSTHSTHLMSRAHRVLQGMCRLGVRQLLLQACPDRLRVKQPLLYINNAHKRVRKITSVDTRWCG